MRQRAKSGTPRRQVVLVDLDDTLYPEHDYFLSGLDAVVSFLASKLDRPKRELSEVAFSLLKEGRAKLFDRVLHRLDCTGTVSVETLVHVYRTHQPRLALFADVLPAFTALRTADVRLGLITDGVATVQWKKISALGLQEILDLIICTDDLPMAPRKPSPVPYMVAMQRLSVEPAECIYIADDRSKDFAAPRKLGIGTIRVDRKLKFPLEPRRAFAPSEEAELVVLDLLEAISAMPGRRAANASITGD
jgi:putative hydrolase of the HAD superfamily